MKIFYPGLIHKDKYSDYGISFPDFPGCISAGGTVAEAVEMGTEALNLHISHMVEDGEEIPAPTLPEDIEPEDHLLAVVLVEATIPGRKQRINITLDANLLEQIDARVGDRQRSAFLEQAAKEKLSHV